MEELEMEIDTLRETNDELQREIDVLTEERDSIILGIEQKAEKTRLNLENEWRDRILHVEEECKVQLNAMSAELDIMRNAFSGDAGGWVQKKTKTGREYFENLETGETREDMPESMFVAQAMQKADEADDYIAEIKKLKEKNKAIEMSKRELETSVNKIMTELNALKKVEKGWRDMSKSLSKNLADVAHTLDDQAGEIIDGMEKMMKDSDRLKGHTPGIQRVGSILDRKSARIADLDTRNRALTNQVRGLESELKDANEKVKRLSGGIEEEVERLVQPMRVKVADSIVLVMREKAARSQERRQMADLWPPGHLMPTLLLTHRALDEKEIKLRANRSQIQEASKALCLEIRKNVMESKQWKVEYDEYGRQYYQHAITGETEWEEPEIVSYKPPPGRDDMGNPTATEEDLNKRWKMKCDHRGVVYFQSDETGEIQYEAPNTYRGIPPGRDAHLYVAEAASIVVTFLKGQIEKHLLKLQANKEMEDNGIAPPEEEDPEDLSKYLYDIETIEMLAAEFEAQLGAKKKDKKKGEEDPIFLDKRDEVPGYEMGSGMLKANGQELGKDKYIGPTLLQYDITECSFSQMKGIVELYATMEETLERRLTETRSHLRDFSYVMMDMIDVKRRAKAEELREKLEERNKQRELERKAMLKKEKIRQSKIKKQASQRGLSVEQVEEEFSILERKESERELNGRDDDISSIGGNTIGEGEGVTEEKKGGLDEDGGAEERKGDIDTSMNDVGQVEVRGDSEKKEGASKDEAMDEGKVDGSEDTGKNHDSDDVDESKYEDNDKNGNDDERDVDKEETGVETDVKKAGSKDGTDSLDKVNLAKDVKKDDDISVDESMMSSVDGTTVDGDGSASKKKKIVTLNDIVEEDNAIAEPKSSSKGAKDGRDTNSMTDESDDEFNQIYTVNDQGESVVFMMSDPDSGLTAEDDDPRYLHSKEIITTTENLVNFSLFCGYANLRMDQTPEDKTFSYEFRTDEDYQDDDEWLTHSFFLHITKERVDSIREATGKEFDPVLDSLDSKPLNSMKLVYDCINLSKNDTRQPDEPYTPRVYFTHDSLRREHSMWKGRQLMAEVLRFQIQQEAMRTFISSKEDTLSGETADFRKRTNMYLAPNRFNKTSNELVHLRLVSVKGQGELFKEGGRHRVYVRVTVGAWTARTASLDVVNKNLSWDQFDMTVILPRERVQIDNIRFDLYDENYLRADEIIGSDVHKLAVLMNHKTGEPVEMAFKLRNRFSEVIAEVSACFIADYPDETDPELISKASSAKNKAILQEVNVETKSTVMRSKHISLNLQDKVVGGGGGKEQPDYLARKYPTLVETQTSFTKVVDDLRGDGSNHVKLLVGDVQLEEVLKLGHRMTFHSMKKLPNFKIASQFLETKSKMHYHDVEMFTNETQALYEDVESKVAKKITELAAKLETSDAKYQVMKTKNEGILEEVKEIQEKLDEVRNPFPQPRKPVFEELPPLPYVLPLPKTSGLDSKGKKKKDSKNSEVKAIIKMIEAEEMDDVQWDFGERFPNPTQMTLLQQAVQKRNNQMDAARAKVQAERDRTWRFYEEGMQKWEMDDRTRRNQYEKVKKEARKIYLRLDCVNERLNIMKSEVDGYRDESDVWKQFLDLHDTSKNRVVVMRAKLHLETQRHRDALKNHKDKMLRLIDARRRAYSIPCTAMNEIEYQSFCEKANIAIRTIRYEILDCKQQLLAEGVRFRNMLDEENCILKSELSRVRMLTETLNQKNSIDKISERHQYEAYNLLEDIEKLKLVEAEKDDRGFKDTIDDLGERYVIGKVWDSPEIQEQRKTVDLIMDKIKLTNGVKKTAAVSQQCILDVMMVKWGVEFAPARDSWCENSDYERSQKLLYDVLQWLSMQRERMSEREAEYQLAKERALTELNFFKEHIGVAAECHDNETTTIIESTSEMIKVVREEMVRKDADYKRRLSTLEASVTDLSKECHDIREEKYKQAVTFSGKVESLMSLVATLQTTLEHQSALMEIAQEEKERIVLQTRLGADSLRYQLRLERKHTANLLFIIHAQRGVVARLNKTIEDNANSQEVALNLAKEERRKLRVANWEQLFCFAKMCTTVDDLFEFFAMRIANLAGSRKSINDALRNNGAAVIFAAMCKSPRPVIRKLASRALGGMGWDGFVETRVLMWDCMMEWNLYRDRILQEDNSRFDFVKEHFVETGTITSMANFEPTETEFNPAPNASLRTIIKQRRQFALRAKRAKEGPNLQNLQTLNMRDGIIGTLVKLCNNDGKIDWEIVRNASLAISVASYEERNLNDMVNSKECIKLVIHLCTQSDPEIQVHGGITLANMCHENQEAQIFFGNQNAIQVLLEMCENSIPDILEAATSALTNLTCLCDQNCLKFLEANGVPVMVDMLTNAGSENFMDTDQNDEVQSNASEILANISRYDCELTVKHFNGAVIDVLNVAVASVNKMVRKHTPLVLGNISQNEWCRSEIGKRGGIEALFLALEDDDNSIQANVLWALCNLMWHPPNQERAGRFIQDIIPFLSSTWLPIQTNAAILLANVLYYNNPNRIRLLELDGAMELIISLIRKNDDWAVTEGCLRAVLSLSYIDAASLWLGTEGDVISIFIDMLGASTIPKNNFCSRYSLEIINNMCIHHTVRRKVLDSGGTDAVVMMLAHSDYNVQETARSVLELLEDVTPAEVMARTKKNMGLQRMVKLISDSDPLVRSVAAESIGEEVWKNPQKQSIVNQLGGVAALIGICANPTEAVTSILPALWSLRNVLHANPVGQDQFMEHKGSQEIILVLRRCISGEFGDQSEKVLESCLGALASATHNHDKNCRHLLQVGLETLMDLAEGNLTKSTGADKYVRKGSQGMGVVSLAKSLLTALTPYNYVVCRNCQKRQNLVGTHCVSCGHLFFVDVAMDKSLKEPDLHALNKSLSRKPFI